MDRINIVTSHRRMPVSTFKPLDSGMRRNDGIRNLLQKILLTLSNIYD